MNEKLNIQELSAWLASENGLAKEDAEIFIKEFFSVIEDALEREKYVKIKGLGIFKLIEVESRESVNINTKERFEIPGYTKVSFTPDAALKDVINKPFAHFETVVLNENTVFDEKEEAKSQEVEEEKEEEKEKQTPLPPMAEKQGKDSGQKEEVCADEPDEHKSRTKLYAILAILVLLLLGGILFFANRYRMANEKMDRPVTDILMDTHPLQEDSVHAEEEVGYEDANPDTIQLISSQTPVGGQGEE